MKLPYAPPKLRALELAELTAEQRAWIAEERARREREIAEKRPS